VDRAGHGQLHPVHRAAALVRDPSPRAGQARHGGALAAGPAIRPLGITGAALALAASGFYLARLAGPGRRDRAGLAGFAVSGVLGCAPLALRIAT
jgi:hypothetical protein